MNNDQLNPLLIKELREAVLAKRLVLFIGSGLSMLVGGPSWDDIATKLGDYIVEENGIYKKDKNILKNSLKGKPRKHISLLRSIIDDSDGKIKKPNWKKLLQPDSAKLKRYLKLYKKLHSLETPVLTTNWDDAYEKQNNIKNIVYSGKNLSVDELEPGMLVHMHGHMSEGNMIMTLPEYLNHYGNEKIQQSMTDLFSSSKTILFIGYGLEEVEILEYLLRKQKKDSDKDSGHHIDARHYMVSGIDSKASERLKELEKKYYHDLGISDMIFYKIYKKHDHSEIATLITQLVDKIGPKSQKSGFFEAAKLIDEEA